LTKQFLAATAELPSIAPRMIYRNLEDRTFMTAEYMKQHADSFRVEPREVPIDELVYYNTKYGSPLAYVRPLDLLGQAGLTDLSGKKILDFGYGTVGHLRLMALCGAHAVGVDVDSFLVAMYSEPSDQGVVRSKAGKNGSIRLLNGRYPADEGIRKAVGDPNEYDLIISKNTLKRGYIHPPPEEKVDPRLLVDLGVDDETFVRTVFEALKPGGKMLIYNICPKPAAPGEKYIPWADGRCPFEKALLEKVGFKVLAFDVDDSPAAREQGKALGWDQGEGAMDLEHGTFAHYTLLEKPLK
jgi:SAM-dependent methyltransferase